MESERQRGDLARSSGGQLARHEETAERAGSMVAGHVRTLMDGASTRADQTRDRARREADELAQLRSDVVARLVSSVDRVEGNLRNFTGEVRRATSVDAPRELSMGQGPAHAGAEAPAQEQPDGGTPDLEPPSQEPFSDEPPSQEPPSWEPPPQDAPGNEAPSEQEEDERRPGLLRRMMGRADEEEGGAPAEQADAASEETPSDTSPPVAGDPTTPAVDEKPYLGEQTEAPTDEEPLASEQTASPDDEETSTKQQDDYECSVCARRFEGTEDELREAGWVIEDGQVTCGDCQSAGWQAS